MELVVILRATGSNSTAISPRHPTAPPGLRLLVLVVHGGPNARDHWEYNHRAVLANRGYAVLQVNYRGSTGFGKAFVTAADREWGGTMHLDLVDAVEWAVKRGAARRDRVAIFGGSYGGYAALCGATLTPDLFRCAADLFGPANLVTLFTNIPPSWKPFESVIHRRNGHPERDRDFLLSRSPVTHVDAVKIPILIAQGANDPRVPQSESDQMVDRLREAGREVQYLLFKDEGHGFRKPENRLAFYRAAEAFWRDT
jgi:dipeptidyl aminopeptidase/acylaminoacyl peptidase